MKPIINPSRRDLLGLSAVTGAAVLIGCDEAGNRLTIANSKTTQTQSCRSPFVIPSKTTTSITSNAKLVRTPARKFNSSNDFVIQKNDKRRPQRRLYQCIIWEETGRLAIEEDAGIRLSESE
ncbi:twin-arginine translocation signal domain-containing protein [Halorubellus salinus]|uniref:twin-arginine translocation signal domain-containing protein n=1 Tax=Halorubellus salinus TaxID=755309 RepID=UPI001D060EE7